MSDLHSPVPAETKPVGAYPPSGDDLLPPVEPPSAKFILQLFVVPAVIVAVVFTLVVSFRWLVRGSSMTPESLIQGLDEGAPVARWQRAMDLALMLNNPRFREFKRNSSSATELAAILSRLIDSASSGGGMTDDDVRQRNYLCVALGEMEVPEGIDVLIKAAEANRDPSEQMVRYGALEAIATRAYNLHQLTPPQELSDPELVPALLRLAGDEDPAIRVRAVFALGQIGGPEAIKRLEVMTDDPEKEVRFDAAIALAYRGNAKAAETLAEMLDLEELANLPKDKINQNEIVIRGVTVDTAIEAAAELARQNPSADLTPIIRALERVTTADKETLAKAMIPSRVVFNAKELLEQLSAHK